MNREQLKKLILAQDTSLLEKVPWEEKFLLQGCLHDFLHLREFALEYDIELKLTSSYRDYHRQLKIWNEKAQGLRPVLDSLGHPLDISNLGTEDLMWSILRWNALPGASRHHWGTDFDCYDDKARPQDYEVQLIPQEIAPGGVFENLGIFLSRGLNHGKGIFHGFFRPYEQDLGGVAPEWWHLSHYEKSMEIIDMFTIDMLAEITEVSEIELKEEILKNLDTIYQRYVLNISIPK